MLTIGIDSGSVATKGVLYNGQTILDRILIPTGWSPRDSAREALDTLFQRNGLKTVACVVGTGYGRITMDFAHKLVTEITCHGRGIHTLNPEIRALIDIGGQDSKVISLDAQGSVREFMMNDKCAAGTGRFLQNTLHHLGEDISHLDALAAGAIPQKITSMCTVFAESEIVSLLAKGIDKPGIAAGIVESITERVASLLGRVRIDGEVAFTGGVSQSLAVCHSLERRIGKPLYRPESAQYIGAVGAAVIAWGEISPEMPVLQIG